jgi:hypothetical protein
MDPSSVHELSWSQMYNRINCDPMILDFRPAAECVAGHFQQCERIGLENSDLELNAIVHDQIESMRDNNNHCIVLIAQSDWVANCSRVLAALSLSQQFRKYHRCHCISEVFLFAPFLAGEDPVIGVPSLIECLLPARVFLSGIIHASPFTATQLHFGKIINVTPDVPKCIDITTCFSIVDSSDVDIAPVLERTRPIISAFVRDSVPILVHCHQGISRSASVVIDFVASYLQISAQEAIGRVRQSRSIVEPNQGFLAKLQEMYP